MLVPAVVFALMRHLFLREVVTSRLLFRRLSTNYGLGFASNHCFQLLYGVAPSTPWGGWR